MEENPAGTTPHGFDAARLIDQVIDYAIIGLDASGTIESWNTGAQRLKGYSRDQAIGQSFAMFYTEDDRRAGLPFDLLERAREKGSVEHTGWRVRRDGTRFWGDVIITALHNDDGSPGGFAKVTRDLTAQHQLQTLLRHSEERFRLLVEQVADYAIIALDRNGTIESWNTGAQRLKGYRQAEAIGNNFSIFYTEEDRRDGLPLELLSQARRNGRVEHTGWRVRKDGTHFWGDVIITALRDEQGTLIGFAKVTRDLTARKRFEEARETFFSTFAHDFRTPVNALAGFAELLPDAPEDARGFFHARIQENAQRVIAMTDQLVDYSRLRADDATPVIEWIDVAELARRTAGNLASVLDTERVQVTAPRLLVAGSRVSMERIMTNLLLNALKYSTAQDEPVLIDATQVGDRVRITVTDHGRGIDPADLPTIFDEFERGRLAQADGGSGLGLTSVRLLLERQGGRAWIDSTLGEGTTVTVDLPGAEPSPL